MPQKHPTPKPLSSSYKQNHPKGTSVSAFTSLKNSKVQQKDPRPGLTMLNILNSKLAQQSHTQGFRKQITSLKQENDDLKSKNTNLSKQLEIEKHLRRHWCKDDVLLYKDMELLKEEVKKMKDKYSKIAAERRH